MKVNAFKLLAVILCVVAVFYVSISPIYANDFWLQLKVGELIAEHHAIPKTLLFPFTEIQSDRFNAHEWLASWFFYELVNLFGEASLPMFQGLLGVLLFGLAVRLALERRADALPTALALGLVCIWAENYRHFLRPEMLANVLMLAFWICLERYRRSPTYCLLGLLLTLVIGWANVHGSFVLAPIMAGIYWMGDWLDQQMSSEGNRTAEAKPGFTAFVIFLAVLACTLINPFGPGLLKFVVSFSSEPYVRDHVPEWASTWEARYTESRGVWIGIAILIGTVVAAIHGLLRRSIGAADVLLLLAFMVLAARSVRFVVYLGMVAAFIVAKCAEKSLFEGMKINSQYLVVALLATATFNLAIVFNNANYSSPLQSPPNVKFAEGLVLQLANPKLEGNVLNSLELGAELVYRSYPRLKPSLDSRIDSYGLDYIMYQRELLVNDKLLKEFIARYDVRYILLDSVRFGIFQQLASWKENKWTVFYKDGKEILLQRSDIEIKPLMR